MDENFEKRHKTKKGKKNFEKSRRRRHHMDQIDEEEPSSSNSRRSPRYQRNDKNEESSERKSPKNSDMSKPKNLAENLGNVICSIIKGEENIKTKQFRKNVQNTNQNTMKNLREFSRLLFDWKLTTND